jgi:hypothetical protein
MAKIKNKTEKIKNTPREVKLGSPFDELLRIRIILPFLSKTFEDYDKCDRRYRDNMKLGRAERAIAKWQKVHGLITEAKRVAELLPETLPCKELKNKILIILCAVEDGLEDADIWVEHAIENKKVIEAIGPIKSGFKSIYLSLNTNLAILMGEISVFINNYIAARKNRPIQSNPQVAAEDLTDAEQNGDNTGETKQRKHKKTLEGEWSNPMTKSAMMSRINIDGYKKFNTFAKQYGLQKAGNRQLWQIRLDKMDKNTRQKFEKV